MSGIASIILLVWSTFWPPSQEQAKQGLLALFVVCFVAGSYRIWAKEHQRWTGLTGKTKIEALDDRISEFQALWDSYGSDSQTTRLPLEKLIEETLNDLRCHAPDHVHHFKSVAKN